METDFQQPFKGSYQEPTKLRVMLTALQRDLIAMHSLNHIVVKYIKIKISEVLSITRQ